MSISAIKLKTNDVATHPWEKFREFFIALKHVPAFLARRRIADGHGRQLTDAEVSVALNDAKQRFGVSQDWVASDVVPTVSDVAVVQIGVPDHPFAGYLKIARSESAEAGLSAQSNTLASLQSDLRLASWRRLIPNEVASGKVDDVFYVLEEALPGVGMLSLKKSRLWIPALRDATKRMSELHNVTGELRLVDEDLLNGWLAPSFAVLSQVDTTWSHEQRFEYIERLRRRLQRGLLGRSIWVSRIHGDFSPNNVVVDISSGRTTGILDWDRSALEQPAFIDMAQFAIGAEEGSTGAHLGAIVRNICSDAARDSKELSLLDYFWRHQPGDQIDRPVVALLTLLRHIQSNIDKAPRYAHHRLWVYRTVETVLGQLAE